MKNIAGFDTSQCAKNDDLASLKSEGDKLDIDKLQKVLTGLNNLQTNGDKLDVNKFAPVPTDPVSLVM